MKIASWSRVTSEIAKRTGHSFKESKRIYDKLKTSSGRPPSLRSLQTADLKLPRKPRDSSRAAGLKLIQAALRKPATVSDATVKRMVRALPAPAKRVAGLKIVLPKSPRQRAPPTVVPAKSQTEYTKRGMPLAAITGSRETKLAPAAEQARPVRVPKRQSARNQFERILRERGLPVSLARQTVGKEVVRDWRNERMQIKIADELQKGYKQIAKRGYMSKQTISRIGKWLLEMVPGADIGSIRYQFLRHLYGKGGK